MIKKVQLDFRCKPTEIYAYSGIMEVWYDDSSADAIELFRLDTYEKPVLVVYETGMDSAVLNLPAPNCVWVFVYAPNDLLLELYRSLCFCIREISPVR